MATLSSPIGEQVSTRLAPFIGPFNAKMWVKAVARRELGLAPEELQAGHLSTLIDGLRSSLQTLMGRGAADDLLSQISREVR